MVMRNSIPNLCGLIFFVAEFACAQMQHSAYPLNTVVMHTVDGCASNKKHTGTVLPGLGYAADWCCMSEYPNYPVSPVKCSQAQFFG